MTTPRTTRWAAGLAAALLGIALAMLGPFGAPVRTQTQVGAPVNLNNVNGTAVATGNGVTGGGSPRVTIVSDNTPFPIKLDQTTPGTTNAVALAQVGATTTATGQGVVTAGTQRTFLAQKATYTAATTAKTATAAGTGPFFAICGSATTTLRVQARTIAGTVATAAVYGDVTLRKTSAATSGGTATALVKVPQDSSSAASTANLLNYYTALATAGTLVGTIGAQSGVFPITGTVAAAMPQLIFDWTNRQESEAPVLRGTAQCLEAGFGTTTTNAPTLTVEVKWTEE